MRRRRLEWLGHLARMQDHRLPKICLFEWLPKTRPCGGPRRGWRDLVNRDLKAGGVGDGNWYSEQDRRKWKEAWGQSLSEHHKRRCRKECGV